MSESDENSPTAAEAVATAEDILEKLRGRDAAFAKARANLPKPSREFSSLASVLRFPEPSPDQVDAYNRRMERVEREDRERVKRAAERVRNAELARIGTAPVRRELLAAIADDALTATPALDAARDWLEAGTPSILVMLGGVGTGKTVAAAWCIARCVGGQYMKMRDVANLYRAGFGEEHERFVALTKSGFLAIDELTTERDVDLGRAALHELVDERGSRGLLTLLMANRTAAELKERYDARTIDRLRADARIVRLTSESMRQGVWK